MSSQGALTTIAICQLITMAAGLVAVAALVYAIFAFKRLISSKVDDAMARVQPVVNEAKAIAEQARQTAETVGDKVEEAVGPQVAAVAGLIGAVVKCLEIYREARMKNEE